MEKAYIILAHKNPDQVARLIHSLDDNHATFFLHLDTNTNDAEFKERLSDNKVVFVERARTAWGGFGIVKATLNGMNAVAGYSKTFDYIILLSGQHYPIKSNDYINHFLANSGDHIFLEHTTIPNYERWQPRGGLYRIDKYFFGLRRHEVFASRSLNFLSSKIKFLGRRFPKHMKPYAGSQWWILNNYALQYVLDFVKTNKAYSFYHQQTFAPDELFFHNILLNAKDEKVRLNIVNNNFLYMNWADTDVAHPELLKSSDIDNILKSDALFARKFDISSDAEIFNLIDKNRNK